MNTHTFDGWTLRYLEGDRQPILSRPSQDIVTEQDLLNMKPVSDEDTAPRHVPQGEAVVPPAALRALQQALWAWRRKQEGGSRG